MNPIILLLKEAQLSDEKIKSIFNELTQNPIAAMSTISSLGIAPEKLQPVMMQVMTNPSLINDAVEELGLDKDALEKAKQELKSQQ